ncbi:MAG: hypothetical protein LUC45_01635 [Paraprevotella sp.]|nr:hypothetical protein [Paraprevotella sp.]
MIKKLSIIFLLLGLACYFIAAVTVLNKPEEGLVCNGVEVWVNDSLQTGFIQKRDVIPMLNSQKCNPTGKKMDAVKLNRIEQVLLKNPYIEDVTSYKTPGGKVCLRIRQRLPILHVMSTDGEDYYLDRAGRKMPKSSYYADLAVATGHITLQYARRNLTLLGKYIQDHPFWHDQIQQINVLDDGEVELVPRVGEHIILLGYPTDVEGKLDRMKEFYTEGLNKVGWNKYSQINLKYNNLIICKKNKK